jgi:hypothetical protein
MELWTHPLLLPAAGCGLHRLLLVGHGHTQALDLHRRVIDATPQRDSRLLAGSEQGCSCGRSGKVLCHHCHSRCC